MPQATHRPTMQTVISPMIKAYEIQGVPQISNSFDAVGLDRVILVKVASTAVGAWVLGLTRDEAYAAVSHAFVRPSPPYVSAYS